MSSDPVFEIDTIAAIATPPGKGGVGVIRLSGPDARRIGEVIACKPLQPRTATYSHFKNSDTEIIDSGLALFFNGPKSFTGEDVVELIEGEH